MFFRRNQRCQPQSDRWRPGSETVQRPETLHVLWNLLHLWSERGESLSRWWDTWCVNQCLWTHFQCLFSVKFLSSGVSLSSWFAINILCSLRLLGLPSVNEVHSLSFIYKYRTVLNWSTLLLIKIFGNTVCESCECINYEGSFFEEVVRMSLDQKLMHCDQFQKSEKEKKTHEWVII